jgi:hypothetical protein
MNIEKIQKVIEKMISDHSRIKSVVKSEDDFPSSLEEYYFTYPEDKYLWSIGQNSEEQRYVFYYPSKSDRTTFLRFESDDMDKTTKENLKLLYQVVRGKLYGFDDVVNDILS